MNKFRIDGNVVWIKLTQGKETCVDLADWPKVSTKHWCAQKDRRTFYAVETVRRNRWTLHGFLLNRKGVDHKNGNGLDNRRENLREATSSQNSQNRKLSKNSTSGLKGVYWRKDRGKWYAMICSQGKKGIYLGYFDTPGEASAAYNQAAVRLHGEFASLN